MVMSYRKIVLIGILAITAGVFLVLDNRAATLGVAILIGIVLHLVDRPTKF